MMFLIGSALAAAVVTACAAWLLVRYRPRGSATVQTLVAALSFPALAVALFAAATVVTLVHAGGSPDRDPGMPIFAMAFILFYALMIGLLVGVPIALWSVRAFRRP